MKNTLKSNLLKTLHTKWLANDCDIEQFQEYVTNALLAAGVTFLTAAQIADTYYVEDITDVPGEMCYHLNTEKSSVYVYFAGIIEDFTDFTNLIEQQHELQYNEVTTPHLMAA